MKLQWFQVRGYKNFHEPLRLDDLDRLNVVHGDNNVGKSNLLESIRLFFLAIQVLREQARGGPRLEERYGRTSKADEALTNGQPSRQAKRSFNYFTEADFRPDDIFHLKGAQPILLDARLKLDREANDPHWVGEPMDISIRFERGEEEVTAQITALRRSTDDKDLAITGAPDQVEMDRAFALVLERLGPRVRGKEIVPRFMLIRADRTIAQESPEDPSPLATRKSLPGHLGSILLAAENATDARRGRFNRFVKALECVRDLVGPGTWRMRYEPDADRAELCLDPGSGSPLLPLHLMGSGIQQMVVLCAHLVMTGADIVGIEEPELNLRWTVQRTLRDVLGEMARASEGPQLILTSHSGQFERDASIYMMTGSDIGPRVHRTSVEQGIAYTQPDTAAPPPGTRAPQTYVTMEGLIQIPPDVRENLGLTGGGGVVFVQDKDGHYLMLTNDQYFDLFEDRGQKP